MSFLRFRDVTSLLTVRIRSYSVVLLLHRVCQDNREKTEREREDRRGIRWLWFEQLESEAMVVDGGGGGATEDAVVLPVSTALTLIGGVCRWGNWRRGEPCTVCPGSHLFI